MQSILIHHQDGVILILPQQPINLAVIVLQQAHFKNAIPPKDIVEAFIVWYVEASQWQVQSIGACRNDVRLPLHHIALPRSGTQETSDIQQLKFLSMQDLRHTAIHLPRFHIDIEDRPQITFIVTRRILQCGVSQYLRNAELQFQKVMLRKFYMPTFINLVDDFSVLIHHTDIPRLEVHTLQSVLPGIKYLYISVFVIHVYNPLTL